MIMRVTLSHMISGNVAFNFASIVSSIATTLVPYLNKFTDHTKIIGQVALEYLLPLWCPLTLVHTDKSQLSYNTVLVAGVAVSVIVLNGACSCQLVFCGGKSSIW